MAEKSWQHVLVVVQKTAGRAWKHNPHVAWPLPSLILLVLPPRYILHGQFVFFVGFLLNGWQSFQHLRPFFYLVNMADCLIEGLLFATAATAETLEVLRSITSEITKSGRGTVLFEVKSDLRALAYGEIADHRHGVAYGFSRALPCFPVEH